MLALLACRHADISVRLKAPLCQSKATQGRLHGCRLFISFWRDTIKAVKTSTFLRWNGEIRRGKKRKYFKFSDKKKSCTRHQNGSETKVEPSAFTSFAETTFFIAITPFCLAYLLCPSKISLLVMSLSLPMSDCTPVSQWDLTSNSWHHWRQWTTCALT